MLLLENVDFQLSPNQRLVTNMRKHPHEEMTEQQLLNSIPNISNQEQSHESEQAQIKEQSPQRQRTETPSGRLGTKHQKPTKPSKNKGQQAVAHFKDKQTLIFPVTVPIDSVSSCCIQNNSKIRPIPFQEKQTLIFPVTVPIDNV